MFIGKPMKISSKPPEKVVKPIPTSPRKKMVSEKKVVKKVEAEKQVPVDVVEKKQPQADKKPQAKKVLFCFVLIYPRLFVCVFVTVSNYKGI